VSATPSVTLRRSPPGDEARSPAPPVAGDAPDPAVLLDLARALGDCEDFDGAAALLCARLAVALGASRVVLGWRTRGRAPTRPVALSGAGRPDWDGDAERLLGAAMDESIGQSRLLASPAPAGHRAVLRAHEALRRSGGAQGVLTVPLARGGLARGALLAEFETVPSPAAARLLLGASPVAAAWLSMLDRQRPGRLRRLLTLAGLVRPATPVGGGSRARLVWGLLGLLVLAGAVVPVDVTVSAPARIEGEVQRTVAAPIRGYLKAVRVRPGDAVRAGELLAELGDRDLELDRTRLRSELSQHEGAASAAMARGERAAMAVAQARIEETRSRLGLVEHQLEQIQLRAPIDGVLIQGDLWQSVGTPVDRGQTLFVVAPALRHRVVVELDERDLRRVRVGQDGRLALSALPWDALALRVDRVAPAATALDGRNVFELEAQLIEPGDGLRPGLRGVAHLASGRAPLLREWGRRLAERAAMLTWRWRP
jgi:multidrug efflux pump subunit AcrA (membrane-fusion protein)